MPDSVTPTTRLSIPMAIVIAGALIAAAVYLSNRPASPATQVVGEQTSPTQAPASAAQPAGVGNFRPVTGDDHSRGAANGKITIIEYSDLECPFCKRFHTTMKQVLDAYPNDVRWVYRHFPLAQLHSKAPKEAEAAECAAEQGKFWELVDLIFEVTPANNGLNLDDLPRLAQQAGLSNIQQFSSCLDSGKYAKKVQEDFADAQSAGGRGTPYSIIIGPDGKKVPISGAQPLQSLKTQIESLL